MRLFSVIFKYRVKAFFWLFSRCLRQDENEKKVGRTNYTTRRLNHKTQSRLAPAPVDRKDSTLASSDFLPVACINQIFLFVLLLIKDPLLHWKKMDMNRIYVISCNSYCLKITENVAFEVFQFLHFPPIFALLKLICLVTLFDRKIQAFKN